VNNVEIVWGTKLAGLVMRGFCMVLAVERMSNQSTHVLLIEDGPGNADLVRGATEEEAEKRVEQWLVAKYAAKFYSKPSQNTARATCQNGMQ
jgi:hypothetical protein